MPLSQVLDAEARGLLPRGGGGEVFEGTSGSTGIALAAVCAARGHSCTVVLPDDQASEKSALLRRYGASVTVVRTASYASPEHYVNVARRLASEAAAAGRKAVFTDQFENEANWKFHMETTGPEIINDFEAEGKTLTHWITGYGTGGTFHGVGTGSTPYPGARAPTPALTLTHARILTRTSTRTLTRTLTRRGQEAQGEVARAQDRAGRA